MFEDRLRVVAIVCIAVAWVAFMYSLQLPAFLLEGGRTMSGLTVLGYGWWGPLMFQFAWFANPLFAAGSILILSREYSLAALFSSGATLIALQSYMVTEIYEHEGFATPVLGLGSAFSLWLAALLIVAICSLILWRRERMTTTVSVPGRG